MFHFDEKVAKECIENFDLPEYKFASGIGQASGEMVFVLAEEVVIEYLLRPTANESNESRIIRLKQIMQDTTDARGKFVEAAETLIGDVLKDMGFIGKHS